MWVERKYDGIRLMLHKATDAGGSVLAAAYTRARHDWIELVRGLDLTIRALPVRSVILDGELHGTVVDLEGVRPATVYEVYAYLQGERALPVTLKFAAFDLVYLDGNDLTPLSLAERRRRLGVLLAAVDAPALAGAAVDVRGSARREPRGRQSPLLPLSRAGLRGDHHQGSRAGPTASPSETVRG